MAEQQLSELKPGEFKLSLQIKKLFDRIGDTNRYYQDFHGDFDASRKFAESIREQAPTLVKVEERNGRVIMTVGDVKVRRKEVEHAH